MRPIQALIARSNFPFGNGERWWIAAVPVSHYSEPMNDEQYRSSAWRE